MVGKSIHSAVLVGLVICTQSVNGMAGHAKTPDGSRAAPIIAVEDVCAWPNLTAMPNGDIVALIYNQPSHLRQPGNVESWVSSDEGLTWAKRGTAAARDTEESARANVAVGLAANGDLIALVSGWSGPFEGDSRGHVLPTWISRSRDGGATWSVDKESFPKMPTGQDGIPFGDIIVADDSSLRAAVYRGPNTYVYRSDDDGLTWTDPVHLSGSGSTNEVALFHVGDGEWIAAARFDGMDLYFSTDDGSTWRNRQTLTGPGQHPGHIMRLSNGNLLLSYGNRTGTRGVDVRLSRDNGKSWTDPFRVVDFVGDGGYPSSVELSGGRILTAYYAREVEEHDGYHMGVVIWDPEVTGLFEAHANIPEDSFRMRLHPARELIFPTRNDRLYQIQISGDGEAWANYDRHFVGNGGCVNRMLPARDDSRFFRILQSE